MPVQSGSYITDPRTYYVLAYISVWSANSLFIKASATENGSYPYEVLAVTMMTESLKLIIAIVLYLNDQSSQTLRRKVESLRDNAAVGAYFAIPSLVYLVYNGLSFINLRLLEPGTYRVLINSRIIFSGLLLQWFFQIQLSRRQWMGIALLVSACIVEQSGSFQVDAGIMAILLMCLQGLCSSLGGVYFQWLLQKPSAGEIGLWEKNIYLYGYSIVFNFIIVLVLNPAALHPVAFVSNISWPVITIVTTAAFGGISTSLLLRHLDVLVKEYANFAEMVVVAVAQNRIFGTPIRGSLLIAICMVSYSLYLYKVKPAALKAQKSDIEALHDDDDWDTSLDDSNPNVSELKPMVEKKPIIA